MVRIKVCGITRPEDAIAAAQAGADAIGLVFAESPRRVTMRQARAIVEALPPYVSAIGVFVNTRAATIARISTNVGLSEVQLHGDETPAFVTKLGALRVTKALRVRDKTFLEQVAAYQAAGVSALLLDAFSAEVRGGSGKRFDWDLVVGARKAGALHEAPSLILAGGLTPENVKAGIRQIRPWGVDVSGGVESQPGIKSAEKIAKFVAVVRSM